MQFNLFIYFIFSLFVVLIYYVVPINWRKYILLISSFIFYGMLDLQYLPVMLGLIIVSYGIAFRMGKEMVIERKRAWLILGIVIVVVVLILFKELIFEMPLGLSYYSFKIISYLADVYTGKRKYESSLTVYAIYISFFPQILCGPISRSLEFTEQLYNSLKFDQIKCEKGICLILSGLFKKIVIAERIAIYVNAVFADFEEYPWIALWLAAFFYSIQIYCDFAGYSEIAIGIMYILGIYSDDNFKRPYFAGSIQEFWDRWHISLSSWLQEYVYIPLGGNRKGGFRKKINVLVTFLISGFWHGNGSGYLIWGLYHGVLNILPVKKRKSRLQKIITQVMTFLLVTFGWIFFKMEHVGRAVEYILCMFKDIKLNSSTITESILPFSGDYSCVALFLTVMLFIIIEWVIEVKEERNTGEGRMKTVKIIFYIMSIILFGTVGNSSFIYMNY